MGPAPPATTTRPWPSLIRNPDFSVFLQLPDGTLADAVSFENPASDRLPGGIAVADVTGDGRDDVVLAYGGNRPSSGIAVFVQDDAGELAFAASYAAYDIPEPVEIADVNLDGLNDVLVLHGGWTSMGVFLQGADGTLAPYALYDVPYASHYGPQGLEVGNINGDCLPDVAIADYSHGLVVLYHVPPEPMATFPYRYAMQNASRSNSSLACGADIGRRRLAVLGIPHVRQQ